MSFLHSSLIRHSGIAALDQAILSAANFLISIILIRTVPKAEYACYSIAIPVSLFLLSLQNAIVNTPLTVIIAGKRHGERESYVASLCCGQVFALLPAVAIGIAIIALLREFFAFDAVQSSVAAAVCIAAVGILSREFLRSYFFAEQIPLEVLKLDLFYLIVFGGFISLIYVASEVSVAAIFLLMGASSLVVAMVSSRGRGWWRQEKSIKESFIENWQYGRWTLLGVIVTHVQNYSYLYLLGVLIGGVSVADVSAARLLLMPLVLVQAGWSKIAIPHGSRLYEQCRLNQFFREQLIAGLVFMVCIAAYVLFLRAMENVLLHRFLTDKYSQSLSYIAYWAAITAVEFLAFNAGNGLQVARRFKTLSNVGLLTMFITIGCAYFLIRDHGIVGGLTALMIGQGLLALILWCILAGVVYSSAESARRTPGCTVSELQHGRRAQ